MRRASLMVLAALLLGGCGGTREPSDEEQVRATLTALAQGTGAKDYQRLCDEVFADELLDGITRIGLPCEVALRRAFDGVKDPRLTIGRIDIDERRATAEVRSSAEGQRPSSDVVSLVKQSDGWRVSSLGRDSPGSRGAPRP